LIGAILAGGKGSRTMHLSSETPKPLLLVYNKPIIVHQIEYMRKIGIKKIYIVVGYLKEKIMDYLGDGSKFKVDIEYIHQKHPEGSAHAVGLLEPHIKQNFLLFLGDICFRIKDFDINLLNKNASYLTCKEEEDLNAIKKNFAVMLNKKGEVIKVIEKPQNPTNNLKGCGIYIFTPKIFEAIKKTPRSDRSNEYEITDAIDNLIQLGNKVFPLEIISEYVNVNIPSDLDIANAPNNRT